MGKLSTIGIILVCCFMLSKCGSESNTPTSTVAKDSNVKTKVETKVKKENTTRNVDMTVTKQDLDVFIPMAKHQELNENQLRTLVSALKKLHIDYNRITGMHSSNGEGGCYEIIEIGRSGVSSKLDDSYQVIVNFGNYNDGTCEIKRILFQTRPGPRYYGCRVLCSKKDIKDDLNNYKFSASRIKTMDDMLCNAIKSKLRNARDVTLDGVQYKFNSDYHVTVNAEFTYSYKSDVYGATERAKKKGSVKIRVEDIGIDNLNLY